MEEDLPLVFQSTEKVLGSADPSTCHRCEGYVYMANTIMQ